MTIENPVGKKFEDLDYEEQQEHFRSLEHTQNQKKFKEKFDEENQEHLGSIEALKSKTYTESKEDSGENLVSKKRDEVIQLKTKDSTLASKDAYPTKENTIWSKIPKENSGQQKKSWFKKLWEKAKNPLKKSVVTGAFVAGGLAATAGGHEKNPVDSSGDSPKKEKIIKVENSAEVNNDLRQDWNNYIDWLDAQGLMGNEALDHNDLGGAMIDRYVKEHPGTSLSRKSIGAVQDEFRKYRDWVLAETQAGRSQFRSKADEEAFLKHLSQVDNWAGSKTTRYKFPHAYLVTLNGKTIDYNTVAHQALTGNPDHLNGAMTNITKPDNTIIDVKKGFAKIPTSKPTDIAKNNP